MNACYIYGAHSRSQTLGVYLKEIHKGLSITAYLVDNDEPNESEIDGVPVIHVDESTELEADAPIYLGTRGIYHPAIIEKLQRMGVKNIIPVTPHLDKELRNQFLKLYCAKKEIPFEKLEDYSTGDVQEYSSTIFVIESAFDKALESFYQMPDCAKVLQVGASLTDIRIGDYLDNVGDNISGKNKQFCELTGLYWIWKNCKDDVIGLEHYRRHFLLPENWKKVMLANNIDVILPTPLYVHPSLAENYRMRHVESDLEFAYSFFKEKYPDDYCDVVNFMENNPLYSPCNMMILRREALDELCEWMFPILFAVAENGGTRDDAYQNRYPGFLSERLISYFFEKNKNRFHRVYCDKNFLS